MKSNGTNSYHITHFIIIESLQDGYKKTGKELYDDCFHKHSLNDHNFVFDYIEVRTFSELRIYLSDLCKLIKQINIYPLLHFELHGDENSFDLIDDENIPWSNLTGLLTEINIAIKNNLIVIMSSCYGAHLMYSTDILDRSPFVVLIGPKDSIYQSTLIKGFFAFYDELFSSFDIGKALNKLKATDNKFIHLTTENLFLLEFKMYIKDYCQGTALEQRINNLIKKLESDNPNIDKTGTELLLRSMLTDIKITEDYYNKFATKFFMHDLYPDLSNNLIIEFNDVFHN